MDSLIAHIASQYGLEIISAQPLAGGDINEVLLLSTSSEKYVVKINSARRFPGMFKAEAKGLLLLTESQSFQIPKVIATGLFGEDSYLLLEYIESGQPKNNFWETFAENLATLHQHSSDQFGLDHDNYIGSLPQSNTPMRLGDEFYISQRLEPQIRRAGATGYVFSRIDSFYKNLSGIIPEEPPALIHGDLWNGNYLASSHVPVLIDPAVAYASREMDLGMMQLFGGFPDHLFHTYHEIFPLTPAWEDRIPIWQLYYLLVHLNLFGVSYYDQVNRIIQRYS